MEFLLNPAASPVEVHIEVTASGIDITDGKEQPVYLNSINGSSNIALGGTALIPPQIVRFPWKAGPLYFSSEIFIGGGGHSLELTGHQAPFTREHVVGLALNIGISDGRYRSV